MLTAAAVGVGGYAAYRGGEKAVHVGKRRVEDGKRERRRNEERRGYNMKARDRSTRLNDIQERMKAAKSGATSENTRASEVVATDNELQKERLAGLKGRYSEARGNSTTSKPKQGLFGRFGKKKTAEKK